MQNEVEQALELQLHPGLGSKNSQSPNRKLANINKQDSG